MTYTRTKDGKEYRFRPGVITLAGWELHNGGQCGSDGLELVATRPLDRQEGYAVGRGQSENPDRAEAYRWLDARSDDADGDGNPDKLEGEYEIVVVNPANKIVDTIDGGRLDELRRGDPDVDSRGDWGKPCAYRTLQNGKGEIVGWNGYKLGLAIELDPAADGSDVQDNFHIGNSGMQYEGYRGKLIS
jgi:hypothetical protein